MEKNNKTVINAWCMYDWANSVYSLTITTAIFPEYFLAVTDNAATNNKVHFLGGTFNNAALYSYALSFAFLMAAFLSPILTSIADYTGKKKSFLQFFCYLGSASCAYLYFFTDQTISSSIVAFVLAGMGYSGSIVFYNSFLPEIATSDMADKVSARGFAFGYLGSVLLLIVNLVMILKPGWFGFEAGSAMPARIAFLTVGIWWFSFAQYTFKHLPAGMKLTTGSSQWLLNGFKELRKVMREVSHLRVLKRFLIAFFFYNMGVQTVMYMATIFGKKELRLETADLITVILIIQVIAIGGASLFAYLSGKYGNIRTILSITIIWIGVCIAAYYITTGNQFYMLAVIVGFVMGGIQSLSRSTYSKMIPEHTGDHASYFSFYDVMDKLSTFAGTLMFGVIAELSGGMRNSALALSLLFVAGIVVLITILPKKQFNTASQATVIN